MARDKFHFHVRNALVKDGWNITNDPYRLPYLSKRDQEIDLGAERTVLAAKRGKEKIAVEVKSWTADSFLQDLYRAFGQYLVYLEGLLIEEPDRTLYLAVPEDTYDEEFESKEIQQLMAKYNVRFLIFNIENQVIVKWVP